MRDRESKYLWWISGTNLFLCRVLSRARLDDVAEGHVRMAVVAFELGQW
jgi:hypothetical protein